MVSKLREESCEPGLLQFWNSQRAICLRQRLYWSAWAVSIALFIAFSAFTFYPPRVFLFEHFDLKDTDRYGILTVEEYEEIRVFR